MATIPLTTSLAPKPIQVDTYTPYAGVVPLSSTELQDSLEDARNKLQQGLEFGGDNGPNSDPDPTPDTPDNNEMSVAEAEAAVEAADNDKDIDPDTASTLGTLGGLALSFATKGLVNVDGAKIGTTYAKNRNDEKNDRKYESREDLDRADDRLSEKQAKERREMMNLDPFGGQGPAIGPAPAPGTANVMDGTEFGLDSGTGPNADGLGGATGMGWSGGSGNDAGVDGVDTGGAAKGGLITRYADGGYVVPETRQGVGFADGGPLQEAPQGGPESIGASMAAGVPQDPNAPQTGPVGPISGPGGPTEDAIPAELPEGSFVLNAKSVGVTGQKKLNSLVNEAMEAMGPEAFMDPEAAPGPGGEAPQPMPVNVSNGEWVLSPPLVAYFGLEFWEKLNDKGLPEGEKSTDKAKQGFKAAGLSEETPEEESMEGPEMSPEEMEGVMGFADGGLTERGLWGEYTPDVRLGFVGTQVRDKKTGVKDQDATNDLINNNIAFDTASDHNTMIVGKVINSLREVMGDEATATVIRHAERASDIAGERADSKKKGLAGGGYIPQKLVGVDGASFMDRMEEEDKGGVKFREQEVYDPSLKGKTDKYMNRDKALIEYIRDELGLGVK